MIINDMFRNRLAWTKLHFC